MSVLETKSQCKQNPNEYFGESVNKAHYVVANNINTAILNGEKARLEKANAQKDRIADDILCKDAIGIDKPNFNMEPTLNTIGSYALVPTIFNGPGLNKIDVINNIIKIHMSVMSACKASPNEKFYRVSRKTPSFMSEI